MRHVSKCFGLAALAVVLVASTSQAQRQGGRGFGGPGGGGATGLLAIAEVQKEINLTDKQKEDITALTRELRQGSRPDFQSLNGLSGEERQAKLAELRKQMEETAKKAEEKLKGILDANQLTRLGELRIQREGTGALARAEVADKLGLSQEQKDKIKKLRDDATAGFRGGRNQNQSDEDRQKARTEARERMEKLNSETLAVLTDAQKESFEKMKGKKFDFPQQPGRRAANKEL